MFKRYALWPWNESELDEFIGKALHYAAESLAFATNALGRGQLVVVDFNRFKQAPVETIEAICQRLNLGEWSTIKNHVVVDTLADGVGGFVVDDPIDAGNLC